MPNNSQFTASLLRRILEFLLRQPVTVALGELKLPLERLEATIRALEAAVTVSEAHGRAGVQVTGRIRALVREAKFSYLRPVAAAARLLFKHDAQLRDSLQVRKGIRSPEQVLEALHVMAETAKPFATELAQAGIAADFAERTTKLADSLKEAIDARAKALGLRSNASETRGAAADDGRKIVYLIDAMVTIPLGTTPPLLAEWKRLLKLRRQRSAAATDDTSPGDATPSSPSNASSTAGGATSQGTAA